MTTESRPEAGQWIGWLCEDAPKRWTQELRAALDGDAEHASGALAAFAARWDWLCPAEVEALSTLSRRDRADLRDLLRPSWTAPAKSTPRLVGLACIAIPEALLRVLALAKHFHVCFGAALGRCEEMGILTYQDGRAVWTEDGYDST